MVQQTKGEASASSRAGHLLSGALRACNLSREKFAELVGVSREAVDNWCSGRTKIGIDKLLSVIEAFEGSGLATSELQKIVFSHMDIHGLPPQRIARYLAGDIAVNTHWIVCWNSQAAATRVIAGSAAEMLRLRNARSVTIDCEGSVDTLMRVQGLLNTCDAGGILYVGVPWQRCPEAEALLGVSDGRVPPLVFARGTPANVDRLRGRVASIEWREDNMGFAAASLLIEHGHTRLLVVLNPDRATHLMRMDGIRRAAETLRPGLRVEVECVPIPAAIADHNVTEYTSQRLQLLLAGRMAQGVITGSPNLTGAVCAAAQRAGVRWPKDFSIVSIGGEPWMSDIAYPPITFVCVPATAAGRQAAELIIQKSHATSVKSARPAHAQVGLGATVINQAGGSVDRAPLRHTA